MAKKPTTPIKITARLLDGRINSVNGILMFDSILYHAWFEKNKPEVFDSACVDSFDGYIGLPLRQLASNRWAASRGIYTEGVKSVDYINKRPNFFNSDKINLLDMDKGIISDAVGQYRSYRMPNIIRLAEGGIIEWWAMGHRDEVLNLLGYIRAVGKKNAAGYGFVAEWTVENCEEDFSLWHPQYGLMRPVEVGSEEAEALGEKLNNYIISEYCIRPPYWKMDRNARLCYVPIPLEEKVI